MSVKVLTHSCFAHLFKSVCVCFSVSLIFQLPIFDKDVTEKKAGEEEDADLSDSEESMFSGLEDSGSDSHDEEEDAEEGDDEEDDDDAVILDEILTTSSGETATELPATDKNTPTVNMGVLFLLQKQYSRVQSFS